MWLSRVIDMISGVVEPVLIVGNLYGLSEVANSLLRADGRTYWIEFDARTASDFKSDGLGFSSEYKVASLAHAIELHSELVHPSVRPIVILTNVQHALRPVSEMLSMCTTNRSSIIISGTFEAVEYLADAHPDVQLVVDGSMDLTDAEIFDVLGLTEEEQRTSRLMQLGNRRYATVKKLAYKQLGLEIPPRPSPRDYNDSIACLSKGQSSVTELLVLNRQWKRALDVAIQTDGSVLPTILDSIGADAITRGELESLHRKLHGLPSRIRSDEKVLYWLLVAEISLGFDSGILQEVRQALGSRSLPRLRALLRLLGLDHEKQFETHDTNHDDLALELFAAHLQSYASDQSESVGRLRRLMDKFDESGNEYRVVQTMLYLTNSLVMSGDYIDAIYWGRATLDRAISSGADELEITAATGLLAYVHLLTGSIDDAAELLSRIVHSNELVGKPYAEGILSTMADHFAVNGHFSTALEWYELSASRGTGPPVDIVAPDIALMLVRLNRSRESEARFRLKLETLDAADDAFPWVQLAYAISSITDNTDRAIAILAELLDRSENTLAGPFLARAALLMSILLDSKKRRSEAFRRLDECEAVLLQLAPTGWCLLTGGDAAVRPLLEEWLNQKHVLSIRFLGDDFWEYREVGSDSLRSMRIRELIFILSVFPNGLTAEELAGHMGWGLTGTKTVRSHLRNLREHVPVSAGPYRLSVKIQADYLEVTRAIDAVDVNLAISTYNGLVLPRSDIPFVREYRMNLESSLRSMVLQFGDPVQIAKLALRLADDRELLEVAVRLAPGDSPMRFQLEAQLARVRRSWDTD